MSRERESHLLNPPPGSTDPERFATVSIGIGDRVSNLAVRVLLKFVVIIREPVARAISSYWFKNGEQAVDGPRKPAGTRGSVEHAMRVFELEMDLLRPCLDHYPRAKSEDDAVGAPRLVLRRWDTTVVPRRVPPAPMRSKCPKGRGRVPRPTSQLEVLVGRAGDESVRQ